METQLQRGTELRRETEKICDSDVKKLRQRMLDLIARMERLNELPRRLNAEERVEFDALDREARRIGDMSARPDIKKDSPCDPFADDGNARTANAEGARFVDQEGRPLHVLTPDQKLVDLPSADGARFQPLSLGKLIVGLTTGRWTDAKSEQLAMAENWNSGGGFLVSDVFTRAIIDFARAHTAVIRAGAITIPWTGGDTLKMARVAADPIFEVVAENAELTERELTFGQRTFTAEKIACLISMSRELASDAPNAAEIVEQTLARALAVEIDRLALVGSGSAEPNGLLYYTGVQSTDSIGAIAWEDVHAAKVAVENNNFTPTGYICSPTIGGNLDIITGGDGANSSKVWLGPPPSLADVPRFTTTNCPDANLFVGQWNQFAIAMRQDAQIEISSSAGDAFKKHQLWIKITWRGDVGCLSERGFHILKGIT
ncbi:MAG: phage major capsid protein [Pirellulales bacterium]|nr:phage major capsid protein [Pirellulales bacterium]